MAELFLLDGLGFLHLGPLRRLDVDQVADALERRDAETGLAGCGAQLAADRG